MSERFTIVCPRFAQVTRQPVFIVIDNYTGERPAAVATFDSTGLLDLGVLEAYQVYRDLLQDIVLCEFVRWREANPSWTVVHA